MNKEELERQLSGFISSIESKRSEISMLYNEYPVASVVRKSQIMNEIRRLNGEIAVLEDIKYDFNGSYRIF